MDNYIKTIKIADIIPIEFQEEKNIEELAKSISKYGIIEPILVREKDNKYEILAGKKRYQAARMIGLTEIPVLIRNIKDDIINSYENPNSANQNPNLKNRYQKENNDINIPNTFSRYQNSNNQDIVNLSELSINKEYKKKFERDELKMNNNELNNQLQQNQPITNPTIQEPTFGGRFFPSLEDEPTNMNMSGGIIGEALQNSAPIPSNSQQNNLIDLTDLNNEQIGNQIPQPQQSIEQPNPTPMDPLQTNIVNMPEPSAVYPTENPNQTSEVSAPEMNTLEVNPTESQINYNAGNIQPIQTSEIGNNTNINNEIPQQQMMPPVQQSENTEPQFDMTQSLAPAGIQESQPEPASIPPMQDFQSNTMEPMAPLNEYKPINNTIPQDNLNTMPGTLEMPNQNPQPVAMPELDPMALNMNMPPIENEQQNMPNLPQEQPIQEIPQKEVTPVINTIKSLAENLKEFGYNININEEELSTSTKITIEVLK